MKAHIFSYQAVGAGRRPGLAHAWHRGVEKSVAGGMPALMI